MQRLDDVLDFLLLAGVARGEGSAGRGCRRGGQFPQPGESLFEHLELGGEHEIGAGRGGRQRGLDVVDFGGKPARARGGGQIT